MNSNVGTVSNSPILLSSVPPQRSRLASTMARPSPPLSRRAMTNASNSIEIPAGEDSHGEDPDDVAEDATDSEEVYCFCRQHSFGEVSVFTSEYG